MLFSVVIGVLFQSLGSLTVCNAKVINGKCDHSTFTLLYLVAFTKVFVYLISTVLMDKRSAEARAYSRSLLGAIIAINLLS